MSIKMGSRKYALGALSRAPTYKQFEDDLKNHGYGVVQLQRYAGSLKNSEEYKEIVQWCSTNFGHRNWVNVSGRFVFTHEYMATAFAMRWK